MVIYKITNKINGKLYIGQTTRSNPYKRFTDHFKKTRSKDLVRDAAGKYGKDSLEFEVIYCAFDLEELNRAERFFISKYNSLIPNGYNIQLGGDGTGRWSEESKLKSGKKVKDWYKKNSHPLKGKNFSPEHIENLSKVRKGFDSPARRKAREKAHDKQRIGIIAINIKTKEETTHKSIIDCARKLGLEPTNISRVLSGKQNRFQHKGYTFRYIDRENNQITAPKDRELKYITPINKGGYSIKVFGKYLGWTKNLNEAKQIRDEYLKLLDKQE